MKTNLGDVKHLDRVARAVGARRILVSHVLPYSEAMEKEMLCLQTLTLETFTFAPGKTELSLPRIDVNNTTKETLFSLFQGFENLTFMGNRVAVDARRCRFVHERTSLRPLGRPGQPVHGASPLPPDLPLRPRAEGAFPRLRRRPER